MISELTYRELVKYREPYCPEEKDHGRFEMIRNSNYITILSWKTITLPPHGNVQTPDKWVITEIGKDALAEFEKEHNKEIERKRQQRFQNKISILGVLVPFITFFVGLVVEHYVGILAWIASLFHSS